jgi:hypothetical protein
MCHNVQQLHIQHDKSTVTAQPADQTLQSRDCAAKLAGNIMHISIRPQGRFKQECMPLWCMTEGCAKMPSVNVLGCIPVFAALSML